MQLNDVEIWFQDEARFGQQKQLALALCDNNSSNTHTFLVQYVRKGGDAVGLLLPYANTDTMEIHLRHISSQIPAGRHGVIVLDKAGWHTTKKLPHFQNLTLLPLPAASPELNPCEQVWKHLRRTRLSNRTFKDEEELLDACSDAWNEFTDEREQVRSLTSRAWARV